MLFPLTVKIKEKEKEKNGRHARGYINVRRDRNRP